MQQRSLPLSLLNKIYKICFLYSFKNFTQATKELVFLREQLFVTAAKKYMDRLDKHMDKDEVIILKENSILLT